MKKPELSEFKKSSVGGGKYADMSKQTNNLIDSIYVEPSWKVQGKYKAAFGGGRSLSILDFLNRGIEFDTEQEALDFAWKVAQKWHEVIKEMYKEAKLPAEYKEGGILNKEVSFKELFTK